MFETVLVANRGEIARRIIRTVQRMGLRAVAVHSEADARLPYVREADDAVGIGPAAPAQSYRDADALLEAARQSGAEAVHPGYGFLAEDAGFARRVQDAGLVWVGPSPEAIEAMGDKIRARNLVAAAGVPVSRGTSEPVGDPEEAVAAARDIGFPVMVKASAGGGGHGHGGRHRRGVAARPSSSGSAASPSGCSATRPCSSSGSSRGCATSRCRSSGLADGRVVALGERDCSVQRRNQKVAEETPVAGGDARAARRSCSGRRSAPAEAVGYRNAGTVECLLDVDSGEVVFLEMNTRLQVEHPVTEMVTGIDLVEQQLLIAAGRAGLVRPRRGAAAPGTPSSCGSTPRTRCASCPGPARSPSGRSPRAPGVRVDSGYAAGTTVTPHYDSLMAKLVVHGADREQVLERARAAVAAFRVEGPKCNLPFFAELLDNPEFVSGEYDTGIVGRMRA